MNIICHRHFDCPCPRRCGEVALSVHAYCPSPRPPFVVFQEHMSASSEASTEPIYYAVILSGYFAATGSLVRK